MIVGQIVLTHMNLIIDIGNTRVKTAVMQDGSVVAQHSVERLDWRWLDQLIDRYGDIAQAIVCSTREDAAPLAEHLRLRLPTVVDFRPEVTPTPLANHYATPETLGADRLAAAVGAAATYPGRDLLIVDFGTAITVDLVEGGAYKGGNISPGVKMRFRALHDYTARLPLADATDRKVRLGDTTLSAIEQGVMQGVTNEIEGYMRAFSEKNDKISTIFTGGDAKYFVKRIKNAIFADCELVVCGLNRILDYNADKD